MNEARRILFASAGALLLALLILVAFVLPAEYGWDPLGSGEALGLVGLSEVSAKPLREQARDWSQDEIAFQLAPFEAVEYKYRLQQGAIMLYQWQADGEVLFEMHSEPDGAAAGYAETFAKARSRGERGSYTAPFAGIHGWFWQNRGQQDVTVRLRAVGFFDHAVEIREGNRFRVDFSGAIEGAP